VYRYVLMAVVEWLGHCFVTFAHLSDCRARQARRPRRPSTGCPAPPGRCR